MAKEFVGSILTTCPLCGTEHEIDIVEEMKGEYFKDDYFLLKKRYHYCKNTYDSYETTEDARINEEGLKDALRINRGLLPPSEIVSIRKKYLASQSDMALILGWGDRTIARYESSLIQDRGNDIVLRKIAKDPEWFLELLEDVKDKLKEKKYLKMKKQAEKLLEEKTN